MRTLLAASIAFALSLAATTPAIAGNGTPVNTASANVLTL